MWWYDRASVEIGEKLRIEFNVKVFIETGTYKGLNIKFWSHRFEQVVGVEENREYFWQSVNRLMGRNNIEIICKDSSRFLSEFTDNYYQHTRTDIVIIYLDAHFYVHGENKTKEERWVVLRELKALAGFENCVLIVHDFNCGNGLNGLIYDNEPLNFELLKDSLYKVNPNFKYYVNKRENCQPHTEESIIDIPGITPDFDTIETIRYHSRSDRLKYRGILYCTPRLLNTKLFPLCELE